MSGVVDASDRFAARCATDGHDPMIRLQSHTFFESWGSTCLRCGRFEWFTYDAWGRIIGTATPPLAAPSSPSRPLPEEEVGQP